MRRLMCAAVLAWPALAGGQQTETGSRLPASVTPVAIVVDEAPGTSNQNGVLDSGEEAAVAPAWSNDGPSPVSMEGETYFFYGNGWPLVTYWIADGTARFGTIAPAASASCASQNDCYVLGVSVPAPRPERHLDGLLFDEVVVDGTSVVNKTWTIHIGGSFDDVSRLNPFYRSIETLMHTGVSTGCGPTRYCPQALAMREQMSVFLLVAKLGRGYQPPPAAGIFTDVPVSSPFAAWIEDLANRHVVTGCAPGLFCPQDPVTRAQMAVMVLRTAEGASYVPPPCITPPFTDVPCSDPFAAWIAEIARRGVTSGCGGGNYCPGAAVTREQMAPFLTRGFGLRLYEP